MNDPKLSRTGCAVDSPADPEAQPRDAAPVSPEQEPVSEQNLHAEVSSPPPLLPQQPRSNKWQWMLGILLVILGSERHVSRLFLGGHTYIVFAVVGILAGRAIDRWSLGGFRRWVYLLPATVLLPYVGLLIWGEQSGLGPYVRGMKALEEQHFERAIPLLNEAIRLKPDFTDAYFNRGLAYLENGQFDKAVADYTEVIRLRPEDSDAYFNLGIA